MGKSNNSRKGIRGGTRSIGERPNHGSGHNIKRAYQGAKRAAVRGTLAADCTAVEMDVTRFPNRNSKRI